MIQKYFALLSLLFFSPLAFSQNYFDDNAEISHFPWPSLTEPVNQKKMPASETDQISPDYRSQAGFSVIRDPRVLEQLENSGYSLQQLFGMNKYPLQNAEFVAKNSFYKSMVAILNSDLDDLLKSENNVSGQSPAGIGMGFSRRIFDQKWFVSNYAKYELVGVINRVDRVSFKAQGCGETRFIYRLSYQSGKVYSRLPFTVLVKFYNKGDSTTSWEQCKDIAKAWVYPDGIRDNQELARWITSEQGPLSSRFFDRTAIESVELNIQAMRIPSAARPTLAGHGTYLLRVLKPEGNVLKETVLENTPDLEKFKKDSKLKSEFLAQFQDRHFVNRLSEGVILLDDKYLAKKAFSYSPHGIGRKENRPFDAILTEKDLDKIKFDQSVYVKSAGAALKRLNDLSCVGCHQARAHAGFHFLGIDKPSTHPFNAMSFEGSGHFQIEMVRRAKYLNRVRSGLVPDPRRDFSFAPPEGEKSKHGHFCGLPGGAFQHWQCDSGYTCQQLDEAENEKDLGKCFAKDAMAGDPVLVGKILQNTRYKDSLKVSKTKECGKGSSQFAIFLNKGGFPSGQCYRKDCKGISPDSPIELCSEAAGDGFNSCLAKTGKGTETFESCLEKTLTHYGFGRCNENRPCRNDFVCAKSFNGQGYCTPSYFLFQIRLDGHLNPQTGK